MVYPIEPKYNIQFISITGTQYNDLIDYELASLNVDAIIIISKLVFNKYYDLVKNVNVPLLNIYNCEDNTNIVQNIHCNIQHNVNNLQQYTLDVTKNHSMIVDKMLQMLSRKRKKNS